MKTVEEKIQESYKFIGETIDNKKVVTFICNYSTTIQLTSIDADLMKIKFPDFNFTRLYLNWWIIGFNKSIDWALKNA